MSSSNKKVQIDPEQAKQLKANIRTKVFTKLGYKNTDEYLATVNILQNCRYFQHLIHNEQQRHDFIQAVAPHAELRYFQKGSAPHYHGELLTQFSIVVRGKGLLFTPKTEEELQTNDDTFLRQEVIKIYAAFFREALSPKKARSSKGFTKGEENGYKESESNRETTSTQQEPFPIRPSHVLEMILNVKPMALKGYMIPHDLSREEKLFLLANLTEAENYVRKGDLDMKPVCYLKPGDTFGEIGLLRSGVSLYTVVAVENLYMVSFTKDDFPSIYANVASVNMREKMNFLGNLFPSLSKDSRLKIVYFMEERLLNNGEIVYKEGEEANEVYMIKEGEIELLTHYSELNSQRNLSNTKQLDKKLALKISPDDRISIGILQGGVLFGEEDVFNSTNHTTYAVARQSDTFLYAINKKVFFEVFQKYFSFIVPAFKDWILVKDKWQKERVEIEQKVPYRRGNKEEKDVKTIRIKKNDQLDSARKNGESVSMSKELTPAKNSQPFNEEERVKHHLVRMKSSLSLKSIARTRPFEGEESLATTRYQVKREQNADPLATHRQYASVPKELVRQKHIRKQSQPQEKKPAELIDPAVRLFTPSQNVIRMKHRAVLIAEARSNKQTPVFSKSPFPSLDHILPEISELRNPSPFFKSLSIVENNNKGLLRHENSSCWDSDVNSPVFIRSYGLNKIPLILDQTQNFLWKSPSVANIEKDAIKRRNEASFVKLKVYKKPSKHSRALSVQKLSSSIQLNS